MVNAEVEVTELRFIINQDVNEVYAKVIVRGDVPANIEGWHHKTFPANVLIVDIINVMFTPTDDCVLWEKLEPDTVN
jgi:hypothetical protein